MIYKNQVRTLLLLKMLYNQTDEDHHVSLSDILSFWESKGIHAGRKSVYADIEALIDIGIDIICIKSTQNRYFIGTRLFELPELKLLVDAVESSRFVTRKKSDILIKKLALLTSRGHAVELHRPVYMDRAVKPENESIYYSTDTIHTAIREQKQIRFQYVDYTAQKEKIMKHDGAWYIFSPYALMWNQDYYYAVGYSERHKGLAQFRVDRIVNADILDQPSVSSIDFDPTRYASQIFGMYSDQICQVELLCENSIMRSVIDRFGENVQTEVVDGGHFKAMVDVAPSPPFFAWVFTFSGKIKIVSPIDVLDEMRHMGEWLK